MFLCVCEAVYHRPCYVNALRSMRVCVFLYLSVLNLLLVFAPTIFHVLCLTDTAIRRCPLVAVLGQGKGAQPGARRALAAGRLRLVQAAVVAALQRSLLVRVLGLAHHREGHSAKRLQEKPNGRGSLSKGLLCFLVFLIVCRQLGSRIQWIFQKGYWGRMVKKQVRRKEGGQG